MQDITLQTLLEAGCHFGHKAERWHPKAAEFIYTEKDGVHIIDLAKTKLGLEKAAAFIKEIAQKGGNVLFVATKRQAKGVVKEWAEKVGAPYLVERWIGGFLTNWDGIHKNIQKINRLSEEQTSGAWKKFPKHEQVKLARYLARLKVDYGGVLSLNQVPEAVFIVDVRKEATSVREALRRGVPIVAIVDTNADPTPVDYVIAANDDAVGSITLITEVIARAYQEGKEKLQKESQESKVQSTELEEKTGTMKEEPKKKPGRPKKTKSDQSI